MITIACVWVGDKYGVEYVTRLRNMVARHLPQDHDFICLTDRPGDLPDDITPVIVTHIPGWWAKMALFSPQLRGQYQTIYFDLDMVITGDLTPLVNWRGEFTVCENFTKLAGFPVKKNGDYGGCVMSFGPGWGDHIWQAFMMHPDHWMDVYWGEHQFVQTMIPPEYVDYLQDVMPPGYFLHWRDFTPTKPEGCAVVVFAGSHRPDNCEVQWIKDEWR